MTGELQIHLRTGIWKLVSKIPVPHKVTTEVSMIIPTEHEKEDFRQYLRQCTDAQVRHVYLMEKHSLRVIYPDLARAELEHRGLWPLE